MRTKRQVLVGTLAGAAIVAIVVALAIVVTDGFDEEAQNRGARVSLDRDGVTYVLNGSGFKPFSNIRLYGIPERVRPDGRGAFSMGSVARADDTGAFELQMDFERIFGTGEYLITLEDTVGARSAIVLKVP